MSRGVQVNARASLIILYQQYCLSPIIRQRQPSQTPKLRNNLYHWQKWM